MTLFLCFVLVYYKRGPPGKLPVETRNQVSPCPGMDSKLNFRPLLNYPLLEVIRNMRHSLLVDTGGCSTDSISGN
jgi:hypothetical protein